MPVKLIKELFGTYGLVIAGLAVGGCGTFIVGALTVGVAWGHNNERVETLEKTDEKTEEVLQSLNTTLTKLSENIGTNTTATQVMVTSQAHIVSQLQETREELKDHRSETREQYEELKAEQATLSIEMERTSLRLPKFNSNGTDE